jgi:hypothetical protein
MVCGWSLDSHNDRMTYLTSSDFGIKSKTPTNRRPPSSSFIHTRDDARTFSFVSPNEFSDQIGNPRRATVKLFDLLDEGMDASGSTCLTVNGRSGSGCRHPPYRLSNLASCAAVNQSERNPLRITTCSPANGNTPAGASHASGRTKVRGAVRSLAAASLQTLFQFRFAAKGTFSPLIQSAFGAITTTTRLGIR